MSRIAYTYRVLRYVHDPAVGEALNVGVLAYAPSVPWVGLRHELKFGRLSRAFRGFHRDAYRGTLRRLESAVTELNRSWKELLPKIDQRPASLRELSHLLVPDPDLTFQFGEMLSGVTENLDEALSRHFERLVTSQAPSESGGRRSDQEVWTVYQRSLEARNIPASILSKKTFASERVELHFDHAFKNGAWHVLQPVSLDLKDTASLQRKAAQWLGYGMGLEGQEQLGTIYLLLGGPTNGVSRAAYGRAKALLEQIPVEHRLVEEDRADDFASELAAYLRRHDLLGSGKVD